MLAENAAFVQALLAKHAGMTFGDEHSHLLDSRLGLLAKEQNLGSADALVTSLRGAPRGALLESVIEALTTHETSFFRDVGPFRVLAKEVLPSLIRQRSAQRRLSIWSAACSTGQEPYSLAMLLRERFPELGGWHVQLWATDVSRPVVDRAREGVYTESEVKRGLTAAARHKYFHPKGESYVIDDSVRRMISWNVMNLCSPWPPMSVFDLVLMRNVLIYFSEAVRSEVLERTAVQLAGDGILMLGVSETTFGLSSAFVPMLRDGGTVYRRRATRDAP